MSRRRWMVGKRNESVWRMARKEEKTVNQEIRNENSTRDRRNAYKKNSKVEPCNEKQRRPLVKYINLNVDNPESAARIKNKYAHKLVCT